MSEENTNAQDAPEQNRGTNTNLTLATIPAVPQELQPSMRLMLQNESVNNDIRNLQGYHLSMMQEITALRAANAALERRISAIERGGVCITHQRSNVYQVPLPVPPTHQPGSSNDPPAPIGAKTQHVVLGISNE